VVGVGPWLGPLGAREELHDLLVLAGPRDPEARDVVRAQSEQGGIERQTEGDVALLSRREPESGGSHL
jgi:hypothetical protein